MRQIQNILYTFQSQYIHALRDSCTFSTFLNHTVWDLLALQFPQSYALRHSAVHNNQSGLIKPRMFGIIIKATLHVFVQLDFLVEKNSSQLGQKWSGPNCGQQGALQSYDVQNLSVSCRVVGLPTWKSDQAWRNSNVLELWTLAARSQSSHHFQRNVFFLPLAWIIQAVWQT